MTDPQRSRQVTSAASVSEVERNLRARVKAGAASLADYHQLADLLKTEGRLPDAAAVYEEALGRPFRSVESARLGWEFADLLHHSLGESAAAAVAADRALAVLRGESDTREVALLRGLCYSLLSQASPEHDPSRRLEWLERAVQALETVLAQAGDDEDTATAEYELAGCYYELRHTDRSIAYCRAYLRRNLPSRDRHLALMILANSFLFARRLGEAEEAVREALQIVTAGEAGLYASYVTLGIILRAAERPGDARSAFERALELIGDRAGIGDMPEYLKMIYQNLGELYYNDGEFERAKPTFLALLRLASGSYRHRILNWLGTCSAALGQQVEARHYYRQVLASPDVSKEDRSDAEAGLSNIPPESS